MSAPKKQLAEAATRLLAACKSGALPTVRATAQSLYGGSPAAASSPSTAIPPLKVVLATAAEHGQADVLRYLMRHMPACVDAPRPWNPPLPCPAEQLAEPWKSAPSPWAWGDLVIHRAVLSSQPPVVQALLDAGMEVDCYLDKIGTPLLLAIQNQDAVMTRFLLDKGANPNETSWVMHDSLLALVAGHQPPSSSSRDVLVALLDHGARIPGSRALYAAARAGNLAAAELLLERGADVNEIAYLGLYQDSRENVGTALHVAAEHGHTAMVELLLKHGARRDIKNELSETARDVARKADIIGILASE
ncbi:hypothetical protein E4U21_000268 [Claviceps maximensis]|nr:hypothetical protein E4U21_000268 [Claviceps maximensis]